VTMGPQHRPTAADDELRPPRRGPGDVRHAATR
jgi:hypothetical protein